MLGETAAPGETAALPESAPARRRRGENIYEVMKQHMRRKQEEIEAQMPRCGRKGRGGRPGPMQPAAPTGPRPVEKAGRLSDLNGVWQAARNYLLANSRMLESVLGDCSRVTGPTTDPSEVALEIPKTQERFTTTRAGKAGGGAAGGDRSAPEAATGLCRSAARRDAGGAGMPGGPGPAPLRQPAACRRR